MIADDNERMEFERKEVEIADFLLMTRGGKK